MRKIPLFVAATLGLTSLPTVPVQAVGAAAANSMRLSEIVVTATKRAASLQNVPVAVQVLSRQSIRDLQITHFQDMTRAVPAFTYTQSRAAVNNTINLRGIGTYALSQGVEPGVLVIVDGVPLQQIGEAFDNMDNVQQIQVLEGPQDTLFGKNASDGVIDIVTRDPSRRLEADGAFTATTDGGFKEDASVSGPLSRTVQYRVSGYYNTFRGNVRNLSNGHMLNDEESWGIRTKLRLEPTSALRIMLMASFQRLHESGTAKPFTYANLNYVPKGASQPVIPSAFGVSIMPNLAGLHLGNNNYYIYQADDGPNDSKMATMSAKGTYDLGFANLISVTTWQQWRYLQDTDVLGIGVYVNGNLPHITNPPGPPNALSQGGPFDMSQVTQEIRLASKSDGPLSYIFGVYYAGASTDRVFTRGPALILSHWHATTGSRTLATYASVGYKLPTRTSIDIDGRLNSERINDSFVNLLPNATVYVSPTDIGTCGAGSAYCAGAHTSTLGTYKVSIDQALTRDVSVYVSRATGQKGWAYNIVTGYNPLSTMNPVKAERDTAYEVGLRSRWLNDRLELDVTGYWTNINNFQAQSSQFINGALTSELSNVGKLRDRGVEVTTRARPLQWLNLFGAIAYNQAIMLSFPNAPCYPGQAQTGTGCAPSTNPAGLGLVQNLSGHVLPEAPRVRFNVGSTMAQEFGRYLGTFTMSYRYQSAESFDLTGDPLLRQGGYGIMNLNLGVHRGHYEVSLFVNNLFNKHYATNMTDGFGSFGTHVVASYLPRDSQIYGGVKISVSL